MHLRFSWNSQKATGNLRKHRVSFDEAQTVFADERAVIFDDLAHSTHEQREVIVGHSSHGRLLLVVFVERQDTVRVISARRATRQERKDYEESNKFDR